MFLLDINFSELGSNTLEILILLLVTAIIAYFIGRLGRVAQSEYDDLDKRYNDCKKKLKELESKANQLLTLNASLDKEKKVEINKNNQLRANHDKTKKRVSELEIELEKCKKKIIKKPEKQIPKSSKEETLERIKSKAADIDFGRIGIASLADKDPLQKIKGIGPFIEQKLNAIGIYTFKQISNFTSEDEDIVNKAIEFFPGRVKRDDWRGQAKNFLHS